MSLYHTLKREQNQVKFEGDLHVKKVILNRPNKQNVLNYEMICQMLTNFQKYEQDSTTTIVILKGNGRAFCAGGDIIAGASASLIGHWSFGANFYRKLYALCHLLATNKKPLVFVMPEVFVGLFPDVGATYFLPRLRGYFGEYLGLTGARLDGMEMVACGLATHFVLSKDIVLLENELCKVGTSDTTKMATLINRFSSALHLKPESVYTMERLQIIDTCFSKATVEEILSSLEKEIEKKAEKWMIEARTSMETASPTSLKVCLRSMRDGRKQTLEQCMVREYIILCNIGRGCISNDLYEGVRAKLIEKNIKPKWEPSNLQSVSKELVNRYFIEIDDPHWEILRLPVRHDLVNTLKSKI